MRPDPTGPQRVGVGDRIRVAVVGVCASGKSLLVKALAEAGYDAHGCAQEHSHVPIMWRRLADPEVLICLDADLSAVRRRTSARWTAEELREQRRRLRNACCSCDLYLHTDAISAEEVRRRVLGFLELWGEAHGRKALP